MRSFPLTAILLLFAVARSQSQAPDAAHGRPAQQGDTAAQPKTKLEAFQARSGSVIITGFEQTGDMKCALTGGSLSVEARELTDAATGRSEYGLAVMVDKYNERTTRSYVDADEVESLLKGLDYVVKADKSVTPLANFQADYRTRGDLMVSSFNNKDRIMLAVQTEAPYGSTCYLGMDQAAALRSAVVAARDRIKAIRVK